MTFEISSTPIAASPRRISPYVLAWGALALLATFYLTALALRPDLVSEHLPIFRPDSLEGKSGEPEGNQGQRAMSKAFAEVQGLRQSVSQMQLELAKLKTELNSSQDLDKALATRIAQLEEKVAAATPSLASAAAAAAGANKPTPAAAKAADKSAKAVAVASAARATAAAGGLDMSVLGQDLGQDGGAPATQRVDARPDAARLETGRLETGSIDTPRAAPSPASRLAPSPASVPADTEVISVVKPNVINAPQRTPQPVAVAAAGAAATSAAAAALTRPTPAAVPGGLTSETETAALTSFGPATVTPAKPDATGPIGLKISNGRSLDALRLSWSLLSDRHAAQLKNLDARYAARVPEGDGDPTFDLIAGPIKTPAEARRICKALAAKNIPCQVGSFNGPSL